MNLKAFPYSHEREFNSGMFLRDYFAAAAIAGITSGTDEMGLCTWDTSAAAKLAYEVADAMLEARKKGQ